MLRFNLGIVDIQTWVGYQSFQTYRGSDLTFYAISLTFTFDDGSRWGFSAKEDYYPGA